MTHRFEKLLVKFAVARVKTSDDIRIELHPGFRTSGPLRTYAIALTHLSPTGSIFRNFQRISVKKNQAFKDPSMVVELSQSAARLWF